MTIRYIMCTLLVAVFLAAVSVIGCTEPSKQVVDIGTRIPDFSANDDAGNVWSLERHLGKGYLVVYFYPAAMTGGCTLQACSYRDHSDALAGLGAKVIGISGDSVNNIRIFKEVHELNFTLLSDVNGQIAQLFGVPLKDGGTFNTSVKGIDISMERSYSTARWTFVLDKTGAVIYKKTDVDVKNDTEDVIAFLKKQ